MVRQPDEKPRRLLALSLGGEIGTTPAGPSTTPQVAQLIPLQESPLALVGTLLITTLPSSSVEVSLGPAESEITGSVSLSSAGPPGVGQAMLVSDHAEETGAGGDGPGGDGPSQPRAARAEVPARAPSWQQYVLGTDEAIERFDREHPELSPIPQDLILRAILNRRAGPASTGRRTPARGDRPVHRGTGRSSRERALGG